MKRVIDGKTYNTDTSTVVARWEYEDERDYDVEATLYQTRGGAFFAVHEWRVEDTGGGQRIKTYAEALTRDEVRRLVERIHDLEIIASKVLEEPPEAEEEETPGATLYLRLPASLKEQVEAAAAEDRLSANAWSMRCLESCLALRKTAAGRAAQ